MEMKVKCSHNKHDDTSYPCLRIYVLCGNETKRTGLFEDARPHLLRKDFHSLHEKVTSHAIMQIILKYLHISAD